MNNNERNQLNFIMGLSDEDFEEWATNAEDDEIKHAIELISKSRRELTEQEQDITDALEFADFKEAKSVLKKFMLNPDN